MLLRRDGGKIIKNPRGRGMGENKIKIKIQIQFLKIKNSFII